MTDAVELSDEGRDRGRQAERPGRVPLRGWKDVILRTKEQMKLDDVPLLAAGVAFFALLALVPALVALVSVVGLVIALWSASSAVKHLIGAISLAYDEEEGRGFLRLRSLALLLTIGGIVLLAAVVAGFVAAPRALPESGAGGVARTVLLVVRWPLLAVVALVVLAVLYRLGPNRDAAEWRGGAP